MGIVLYKRQPLCALSRHTFTRRAPIPGSSGSNTFLCPAMVQNTPVAEKVLAAAWLFATLAVVRSILIDRHQRRLSRFEKNLDDLP